MRDTIQIGRARIDARHAMGSGAAILLLVRERIASDWSSLCAAFDVGPTEVGTAAGVLLKTLLSLHSAGLIEMEMDASSEGSLPGAIRLTPVWPAIQRSLDISLVDLAGYSRDESIVVTPWFGPARERHPALDIFVLMPFLTDLKPVYDDHICPTAVGLEMTIARADDFASAQAVMADVWSALKNARVVIADCTGRNPNVFYEMGIAHTLGKPVILIAQDRRDVPFDIQHLRYLQYDFTPRGMTLFESELKKTIVAVMNAS